MWCPAELIVRRVPTSLKWVWWIQRTSSLRKPRRDSNLDRGSPSFTIHNMTLRYRYYDQTRVSMCCSMKLERYLSEIVTSLYRTHANIIQSLRFAFRLRSSAHSVVVDCSNQPTYLHFSIRKFYCTELWQVREIQSVIFLTNFMFETNVSKQHTSVSIRLFSGVAIFPAFLSRRARRSSR